MRAEFHLFNNDKTGLLIVQISARQSYIRQYFSHLRRVVIWLEIEMGNTHQGLCPGIGIGDIL